MMAKAAPKNRQRTKLIVSLVAVLFIAFGSFAATLAAGWSPKLGLDLAGGFSVLYKPLTPLTQAQTNETVSILRNRIDSTGVSGATVSTQGPYIAVAVPGVKDARPILDSIGTTAQLYFRAVICYAPNATTNPKVLKPVTAPLPSCGPQYTLSKANLNVQPAPNTAAGYTSNQIPPDPTFTPYPSTPAVRDQASAKSIALLPDISGSGRYVVAPAELTGRAVASASVGQTQSGQWIVNYTLTPQGSAQWDALAQKYFHMVIGIDLDGVIQSAPIIQPGNATFQSFGGSGQISGNFTQQSAQALATALNYGALPVPLVQQTVQTVSPTLGHSSLIAGLGAGIAGLILVLIYVLIYYRALGLVVVSGLAVTAALLWAIISALGHTTFAPSFDLAGVTGLIVSIGITVDSYIVYFERLKDETRSGRSVRTSVDRGFHSAWRTVLAADLISLIAAVVLYFLALGPVRGFAFFLGLSTILDVVITYYYTRPLVYLLGRNDRATSAARFGVARGLAMSSEVSS